MARSAALQQAIEAARNLGRQLVARGRDPQTGYRLVNPLAEGGPAAWRNNLWELPLYGVVRSGAEQFGVEAQKAAMAERILAGVAATGIGGAGLMALADAVTPDPAPYIVRPMS
jgi:hypothetical protein